MKKSSLGSFVPMWYSIRDGTKSVLGHHVLNGGEGALNVEKDLVKEAVESSL